MRLTNTLRDAFIRAAMQDVPRIDHKEEIRKLVIADLVSQMPAKIQAIWKDNELRQYLKTDYNTYGNVSINYPSYKSTYEYNKPKLTPEAQQKVDALASEAKVSDTQFKALETKLKGAAYACTTRKQLAELLPEFEKYLPADEGKAIKSNLPAVANLVADFTKAGWPKNQPKPTPVSKKVTAPTKIEGAVIVAA